MNNIILIAPPAAGKGTQATMLKDKYNIAHISTGDLLRNEVATGSKRGLYIGQIQAEGGIVDDDIVLELLEKRIQKSDCDNGYILDGFPRTINQAEKFNEMIARYNKPINYVIFLDIKKEEAMKRTLGRVTCPECKTIYSLYKDKFEIEGICNKCHFKLEYRNDDNEETFNKRFDTYLDKTKPLIDYYQSKGLLSCVKCCEEKEDTFKQVEAIINKEKND